MGFAGRKDEGVARFDWGHAIFMAHGAFAGKHVIKFPLCAVQMIRIRSLACRNANDFNVKRMRLVEIAGLRLSSQCFGDFSARSRKFSFWRRPRFPWEVVCIYFVHCSVDQQLGSTFGACTETKLRAIRLFNSIRADKLGLLSSGGWNHLFSPGYCLWNGTEHRSLVAVRRWIRRHARQSLHYFDTSAAGPDALSISHGQIRDGKSRD